MRSHRCSRHEQVGNRPAQITAAPKRAAFPNCTNFTHMRLDLETVRQHAKLDFQFKCAVRRPINRQSARQRRSIPARFLKLIDVTWDAFPE